MFFSSLKKDVKYRNNLYSTLCAGISDKHRDTFLQTIDYVIDEKGYLFDIPELQGSFYEGDTDVAQLILPTIKRLYGKTFISPPQIFESESDISKNRFKLFVLYYDLDEFLIYLAEMIKDNKNLLSKFNHLDRTSETLTLIVDNYIARNLKKVLDCDDIDIAIKKMERERKIKDVLND